MIKPVHKKFLIVSLVMAIAFSFIFFSDFFVKQVMAQSIGVVSVERINAFYDPWTSPDVAVVLYEGHVIDILDYRDGFINAEYNGGTSVYIPIDAIAVIQAEGLVSTDTFLLLEPTPMSEVFSTASMGTILNVIGYFGDYFAVDVGENSLYVHRNDIIGSLLHYLLEYGPVPFAFSSRREPITLVYEDDRTFLTVVGSTNGLNLRNLPSVDGDVLVNGIKNGNMLEVVDIGDDWHFVRFNGSFGYVSARYTTLVDRAPIAVAVGSPSNNHLINQLLANAKDHIGVRYTWGGTSRETGFDCSGFVYTMFRSIGITLNRSSRDQVRNGTVIDRNSLQAGDLVFFATGRTDRISHVGIYLGGGDFIHSSTSGRRGIMISSLYEAYYIRTYVTAARVIGG